MQIADRGTGAKSFRPPTTSFLQATAGRATVPLAGSQRKVQVLLSLSFAPFDQYVTFNAVTDDVEAAPLAARNSATRPSPTMRIHPKVPRRVALDSGACP